ncbi:MAG: hypothetical protein PHS14_02445 [Elusimicrobia bacterium]|nr:hypothetical protein [Elusimicrobiota bacterium]
MRQGSAASLSRISARDWIFLAAAGVIAYGGRTLFSLGFAHDDWVLLHHMAPETSMKGRMSALVSSSSAIVFRPAEIPYFAFLDTAFGVAPLGWQCVALALQVALAGSFMSLLMKQGKGRAVSLTAAFLLLGWPAKDATAFWPIASVCAASAALTLTALNLHWNFVRLGGAWRRAGSAACLIGALGLYDQPVLLFPMWLVVPAEGEEKARRASGFYWAAAAAIACASYQRLLVPWLFSIPHNKEMSMSLAHGAWVYLAGANANAGPRLLAFSVKAAARTIVSQPALALSAVALVWASRRGRAEGDEFSPRLIVWGGAFIALGYLPLVFSSYSPGPLDHMNRLNLLPAVGIVAVLSGLSGLERKMGAALAVAAGAALLAHANFAGIWAESYRRQLAVKEALIAGAPRLKDASGLLLRLPERYVAGKAPVFDAHWDISAALALWTGLALDADVVRPDTRFEAGKVVRPNGRTMPRPGLYLLDMAGGTLGPLADFRGDPADPTATRASGP